MDDGLTCINQSIRMISILVSLLCVYIGDFRVRLRKIDVVANKTVDGEFADREGWLKKSIMTVAKVSGIRDMRKLRTDMMRT
jgi:hypothetical protein